jgi:hypothetical protein
MGERQDQGTSVASVQVMHVGDRTVVWLRGDIDPALERELLEVGESIPATTCEVVVDVARAGFSDLSLARFVESLANTVCVTVRFPTRRTREFLRLTGLDALVQIQASALQPRPARGEVADRTPARTEGCSSAATDQMVTL